MKVVEYTKDGKQIIDTDNLSISQIIAKGIKLSDIDMIQKIVSAFQKDEDKNRVRTAFEASALCIMCLNHGQYDNFKACITLQYNNGIFTKEDYNTIIALFPSEVG